MPIEKTLKIEQAIEGEKFNNNTIRNFNDFKKELILNGINDIFSDVRIKQDKTKYIFCMNNKNIFAIEGETNLINRPQKYYEEIGVKEKRTEEQKVLIRLEGLELQYIKTETDEELALLKKNITKAETLEEKTTDIENVKFKVERLIKFFEQEKDLAKSETAGWIFNTKYDRKDKGLRNIQKTEIKRRLKELKKIKAQIERLANNKDKKYTIERDDEEVKDVKMDDIGKFDMVQTLKQLSDRIKELGEEAPDFITSRNDIILEKGDTVPYFEIIGYTASDAKKISKALKKVNNEYAILDELKLTGAKRQELSQDLQDLEIYLNKVINDPDGFKPSETPFIPTHTKEFYTLMNIVPTPEQLAALNKNADKDGPARVEVEDNDDDETTPTKKKKGSGYVESDYDDSKDAFERGGIGGVMKHWLDQSNMKTSQKQFRGGVGNLALTGGVIFVGWKMISSAFKLLTKKGRAEGELGKNLGWLLGPTALIFGSQARSGEGPLSLFKGGALTEKIANIFSGGSTADVDDNEDDDETNETSLKYKSFPGATALFNGLNYGEMKQFLIKDGDRMKVDPDQYTTFLDMFKTGSKKNSAAAKLLEDIGENDDKNIIDLALTGMGIERDDIQDDDRKNDKFDESASKAIIRLREVTAYMDEKGYNKTNPETIKLIENYIAKGDDAAFDLEELDARGDVFYKETEIVDQTELADEIKLIAEDDAEKEEQLLLAINTFREKMPSASRKIELSGTREALTFKTYDQTSTINLKNKELVGFTPKRFDSYFEAFKAANLTNRIKSICKDKEAQSEKPFYLSAGSDITFDDAKIFSTDFDTEIMTAGRGGSLKKVSPILEKYKTEYCTYLNDTTPKFWKEKAIV